MKGPDYAIHVVVACALLLAVLAVASGYGREDIEYLKLLMQAVSVCLLAGIMFILERMLRKLR